MACMVLQGIGSTQVGGWHWSRFPRVGRHAGVVVCARKKPDIVWEDSNEEIMLDQTDLMQLKLSRLLGESRDFGLAKVVAKKLNPHLNNLEVQKLVKKRGASTFLRMVSECLILSSDVKQAFSDVEKEQGAAETKTQVDEDTVTLSPRPKPSQEKGDELSRERFLKVLSMEDDEPPASATPLTSLAAAVNSEWLDRAEISVETFVKLLDERGDVDVKRLKGETGEEEQLPPRPRKFDRRPRASDTIGRRRRTKAGQRPFTSSPSANRKISKTKGKAKR